MKKKYNTIIDKEFMYDIMARLGYEDIKYVLKNDMIVMKVYDGYYDEEMTFQLVVFKDRINKSYPLKVYWENNNRSFAFSSIDSFIDWLQD